MIAVQSTTLTEACLQFSGQTLDLVWRLKATTGMKKNYDRLGERQLNPSLGSDKLGSETTRPSTVFATGQTSIDSSNDIGGLMCIKKTRVSPLMT